MLALVAQVSNLLYRRLQVGRLYRLGCICGLEIRDTADWKSALLWYWQDAPPGGAETQDPVLARQAVSRAEA